MSQTNTDNIRQIATWLQSQSVSSNGDPNSPVTKRDLEALRDNIANAIIAIAESLDS